MPGIAYGMETVAKLGLLTKPSGMKNADKRLFKMLKENAVCFDQLGS